MSDYGFKTVKNNKNGGKDTAINAKFPMLGFDLSHRPYAYITFHITDTKDNPLPTAQNTPGYTSPSLPAVNSLENLNWYFTGVSASDRRYVKGGANRTSGFVKELIYQFEHGYDFRPACYGTVTGKINRGVRTQAVGNMTSAPHNMPAPAGNFWINGRLSDGNWNKMASFETFTEPTRSSVLYSYMNGMKSVDGGQMNYHDLHYLLFAREVPTSSSESNAIKNTVYWLTNNYFSNSQAGEYPYSFEVDNKYIKIYRTYYWGEAYGRIYFDETFWDGSYNWRQEMKDYLRVKQVEELAGSEIDINIMMFPYQMEDLK